jgi:hypothetical protein
MGKHSAVRVNHKGSGKYRGLDYRAPEAKHAAARLIARHKRRRETDLVIPKPWLWLIRVSLLAVVVGVVIGITGLPSSHAKATVLTAEQMSYQSGHRTGQQYAPSATVTANGNGDKYWWCFYAKVQGVNIANNGISNLTGIQDPHDYFPPVPTGEAAVLATQWMHGCMSSVANVSHQKIGDIQS